MTKKDYILIASDIKDVFEYQKENDGKGSKKLKQGAIKVIAETLADSFSRDNIRFNKEKFLLACGVK